MTCAISWHRKVKASRPSPTSPLREHDPCSKRNSDSPKPPTLSCKRGHSRLRLSFPVLLLASVATSTVEAEYIAIPEPAKEALWFRNLLKALGFGNLVIGAAVLHKDNQGAIRLAINPSAHQRAKHIDVKHHLIRDLIRNKSIALEYVSTGDEQADILTKPLPGPRYSTNFIAGFKLDCSRSETNAIHWESCCSCGETMP